MINTIYLLHYVFLKIKKTYPAVILCHGTASNKDEVGGLFKILARTLRENNIASIRFDFAGCGQSKAPEEELTFLGEVSDTEKVLEYLKSHPNIKDIGILGFSQGSKSNGTLPRKKSPRYKFCGKLVWGLS